MWGRGRPYLLLVTLAGFVAACGGPQSLPKRYAASTENAEVLALAEAGDADAQLALGQMYEDGRGGRPDYPAAADWYARAARQGLPLAQHRLGQLYERGLGVARDYGAAAGWYRRAAEQGLDVAQYRLGYFYEKGLGVRRDVNQAVAWYERAAAGWRSGQAFPLAPAYVVADAPAAEAAVLMPPAEASEPAEPVAEAVAPAAAPEVPDEAEDATEADPEDADTMVFDVAATLGNEEDDEDAPEEPATAVVASREAAPAELADLGAVRVHLASYRTTGEAMALWKALRERYAALLGPLGFAVARLDLGEPAGVFYQLQAGPLADAAAAEALCARLHAERQFCQPMGP